jgi:chemotaxis protein MotB
MMQREQGWPIAGDMLFPEGRHQLSANGKQPLSQYVPRLQSLQNAKVVVYGYIDNPPIGPALQRAGIANNNDLSSRHAGNVVAYLGSPSVKPDLISAGRLGDAHPVSSNDTPDERGKNRRIDLLEAPGA